MSRRQKRVIQLTGITGVVYLAFRYVLPLVVPFLLAIVIARWLKPMVLLLQIRFHLSRGMAAVIVVLIGGSILVWLGYWLGSELMQQIGKLVGMLPVYEQKLYEWLDCTCCNMEHFFHLQEGSATRMVEEMGNYFSSQVPSVTMPYLAECCAVWLGKMGHYLTSVIIVILAIIFYLQEEEVLLQWKNRTLFGEEIDYFAKHLLKILKVYAKTEGILMLLTAIICSVGLYLMGNEYCILLGILIGLVDALPLFGTGTIFIPWAVITLVLGKWKRSLYLLVLYLLCYFLRQILEPRMLGEKLGVTALEILVSVYIGLRLFGLSGLFFGPIAWILWKEIDKKYFLS